jgi:hypothetical protein
VIHRNLKPSSILLEPLPVPAEDESADAAPPGACQLHTGWYVPRIADFGLARRPIDGDPTDVDLFGDEAGFLAPEQAWGRAKEIDTATDVYGLGAVMYFLLAGRSPFRGPTLSDILDAVMTANLVPPAKLRRVPTDLDFICRKCLARRPGKRYNSAGALADDFHRSEQSLPLACRAESGPRRFGKWVRRRPAMAGLIFAVVLGFIGTLGGYVVGLTEEDGHDRVTGPALAQLHFELASTRGREQLLRDRLTEFEQKAQLLDYQESLARAERELGRGRQGSAREILDGCPAGLRGVEWGYLRDRARGRRSFRLKGDGGIVAAAFHPQDNFILAVASNGVLRIWDLWERNEIQKMPGFPGPIHAISFSPDGRHFATVGEGADGQGEATWWFFARSLLPNDRGLLSSEPDWRRSFTTRRLTALAIPRDGKSLVVGGEGLLWVLSLEGDFQRFPHRAHRDDRKARTTRACWLDSSQAVISFREGDRTMNWWVPLRGHSWPGQDGGQEREIWDVAICGSKRAVAFSNSEVCIDEPQAPWDDARSRKMHVIELGPLPQPVRKVAFSPDGTRLAASCDGGTIYVWALIGDLAIKLPSIAANGTNGLAFSPSGRTLAAATTDEIVILGAERPPRD